MQQRHENIEDRPQPCLPLALRTRRCRGWTFAAALLLVWPWAALTSGSARAASGPEIQQAITGMTRFLYANQNPGTGDWERQYAQSEHVGGQTALVALALVNAGQSPQDPRLAKALDFLLAAPLRSTYAVSLRAQLLGQIAQSERAHQVLADDARWLLGACDSSGRFSYGPTPAGRFDHSTTQYGVLGLWQAKERQIDVPDSFWLKVASHFLSCQNRDGGWGYEPGSQSTGSMTAAGLTVLLICQRQLYRQRLSPDTDFAGSIRRGVEWLDKRFRPDENPGAGHLFYYLCSLERVGLAGGYKTFHGQDWYAAGADHILSKLRPDGSIDGTLDDTAFALFFLARGRYHVWASKLILPGQVWNNRPNDLHFLSEYLSDLREAQLHWQCVDEQSPPESFLHAPLLYLAGDRTVHFSQRLKTALKRYLDLGGTLLANADNGDANFQRSIVALCRELYPDYELRPLPPEHPLFRALFVVEAANQPELLGLSNGVRELVLLPQRDWGFQFQADSQRNSSLWKVAANLWAVVSDRGLLADRLQEPLAVATPRPAQATVTVARLRRWPQPVVEPLAWEPVAQQLRQRCGLEVKTQELTFANLPRCRLPLVHLGLAQDVTLSEEELSGLLEYVRRGGTLLIESVGGHSTFARELELQLALRLGSGAIPLPATHPLITGQGLAGGYDVSRTPYRRYAVWRLAAPPRPRLAAIFVADRPAVLISEEDLTLGMLGVRQWGIVGYEVEPARQIMSNIVLFVQAQARPAAIAGGIGSPAGAAPAAPVIPGSGRISAVAGELAVPPAVGGVP